MLRKQLISSARLHNYDRAVSITIKATPEYRDNVDKSVVTITIPAERMID